jgi:hypothetical protein
MASSSIPIIPTLPTTERIRDIAVGRNFTIALTYVVSCFY